MTVKVHLKGGRTFECTETALFDDAEAGWVALSSGRLTGNRTNLQGHLQRHYLFYESEHIVFGWSDIEKIEVTR